MLKSYLKIILAILAITLVQNILIMPKNEDIRSSILASFNDKPKKELFKVYHFLFEKKYSLDSEEGINRYKIFKNNLKVIEEMNTKLTSYKLGITVNTDLTDEEFVRTRLGGFTPEKMKESFFLTEDSEIEINSDDTKIPLEQTNIDWTPIMNPAKNQGMCGSCWAFASIGALEGNYNLKLGKRLGFSEQQLVDCNLTNNGCDGGFPMKAYEYMKTTGIAYSNSYSYLSGKTDERGVCKDQTTTQNFVVSGYKECPFRKCAASQYLNLLSEGPIVVFIDGDGQSESNRIFKHYKEGIIDATMACEKITHAIIAVGYGRDDKGEFLIGRNSWGTGWGENGNFRIRVRSSDRTCFMQDYALLPQIKETVNPVPPPVQPGCMKIYSECGLKGETKEFCGNTPRVEKTNQAGYELGKFQQARVFYESSNCKGGYFTFKSSNACFSKTGLSNLVNNVKSIVVEEDLPPTGCVWFYNDYCLSGEKLEVCSDVADLNDQKYNFGNVISSFKLGPQVKSLKIYLDSNFKGSSATISKDLYGMSGTWMDKEIESVKLIK